MRRAVTMALALLLSGCGAAPEAAPEEPPAEAGGEADPLPGDPDYEGIEGMTAPVCEQYDRLLVALDTEDGDEVDAALSSILAVGPMADDEAVRTAVAADIGEDGERLEDWLAGLGEACTAAGH